MPEILTTKELAKYLRLHQITICKHAAEGKIPGIRIGSAWRFDKEAIDRWINEGVKKPQKVKKSKPKTASKAVKVKLRKKRKS
jgi:excisionase family DNA binding protein